MQGVGFRPFVYGLAREFDLVGWVENTASGVTLEIQGAPASVLAFIESLRVRTPLLAQIDSVDDLEVPPGGDVDFRIRTSTAVGAATASVSPDVATCADCLAEVDDPADRRFGYAFTNCTNCGPRYSIVRAIPYDRPNTTMADFRMCRECQADYDDPTDRRFHAQPLCCPVCGPQLSASITDTAIALRRGDIVAIKGIGGFHLAVLASSDDGVAALRARKHRQDKPFALMCLDLSSVERICELSPPEAALLTSIERPIVLLQRITGVDSGIAAGVAPHTSELGVMLAYTPLHHLLLTELGEAIVCTSANYSDEPIAYRNADAEQRLSSIADRFLSNDRPIHIRVDDSVARVVDGSPYLVRRSRGYAPAPLSLPWSAPRPVLACGAELKNTVALARDRQVFLSHHIGDLKSAETFVAFREAIEHMSRLFEIRPEVVVRDLHPDYLSGQHADALAEEFGLDEVVVQHHHAHVAACLADASHAGPVIGVAFDGAGYGPDNTVWGGEFLIADLTSYRRVGWFSPVAMPGGDAASNQPWRMAAAYLDAIGEPEPEDLPAHRRNPRWSQVLQIARNGVNSPLTSSVGRLFDAVASVLDVRDESRYEGQAAIELEQLVAKHERGTYTAGVSSNDGTHTVAGVDLVSAVLADLRRGVDRGQIAMRFHRGLAEAVVQVCERIRDESGLDVVALSGGVFLNTTLLVDTTERLTAKGFAVLRHRRVPCNDGGISLGQAAVASACDRNGLLGQSRRGRLVVGS